MLRPTNLDHSWVDALTSQFNRSYWRGLSDFLSAEATTGKRIYPPADLRFRALELTPLTKVRVVILGQDPYHGPGQAHGLSFSVQPGMRTPRSLANIYKELQSDLGIVPASHGFLEHWAQQGVLLLNTVLTVEHAKPASHRGKGWEHFTTAIIEAVALQPRPVVFMLWGNHALEKAPLVANSTRGNRHLVLTSPHPSPLSARKGFFGCRHFSKANAYLEKNGQTPIDWTLPSQEGLEGAGR